MKKHIPYPYLDESSIIVGNSLGGALALELGGRSRGIVLVASYIGTSTRWIGRGLDTLHKEMKKMFFDPDILTLKQMKQYEALWLKHTSSREQFKKLIAVKIATERLDLERHYSEKQEKILAICGSHDQISPVSQFYKLQKNFIQFLFQSVNGMI